MIRQPIIIIMILFLYLFRLMFNRLKLKNKNKYLLLSLYIFSIPFELKYIFNRDINIKSTGTLGGYFCIDFSTVLFVVIAILLLIDKKLNIKKLFYIKSCWLKILLLFIGLSLLNPICVNKQGTYVLLLFVFSNLFLLNSFVQYLNKKELLVGIYDGFVLSCLLQFVLAICFPLLEIHFVTELFNPSASVWATRMGTREGAVGTFSHPAPLALFIIISSCFFYSKLLTESKRYSTYIMMIINTITIILTYSRTSYLVFVGMFFILHYIKNNPFDKILSVRIIYKVFLPLILMIGYIVFFSPLSKYFIDNDILEMSNSRLIHYSIGYDIFNTSPLLGVGLNSHLVYIQNILNNINWTFSMTEFMETNPIHNIHIIVAVETGIFGFLLWIYFFLWNILKSKKSLKIKSILNYRFNLGFIGVLFCYFFYGFIGWAPFSQSLLSLFILIVFYASYFQQYIK